MSQSPPSVTVFWSWQSDTPEIAGRYFVHDCLERAAKALGRSDALLLEVDRDTEGVGGTPNIAETILAKIRTADVFVWDATLAYSTPRRAPNPNVMLELGYAIAVLGEGRLIGVMNAASGGTVHELPFDLRHKRWPLQYTLADTLAPADQAAGDGPDLDSAAEDFRARRRAAREHLVPALVHALRAALQEPKHGAIHADVNLVAARSLWQLVSSEWVHGWYEARCNIPQYEDPENTKAFATYVRAAQRPENEFTDPLLAPPHQAFLATVNRYLIAVGKQMVPHAITGLLVISVKTRDWVDDYDARYDRQVEAILTGAEAVWAAWQKYVAALRGLYPEVVVQAA